MLVQEHLRLLHEKKECNLRFVACPNEGCRESMRAEDLKLHVDNQCSYRAFTPPAEDWKCARCTFHNSAKRALRDHGKDVFKWRCAVCKHKYAKKGVTANEFRFNL